MIYIAGKYVFRGWAAVTVHLLNKDKDTQLSSIHWLYVDVQFRIAKFRSHDRNFGQTSQMCCILIAYVFISSCLPAGVVGSLVCHADFLLRRPHRKSPSESNRFSVVIITRQRVITPPQDTDMVDTLSTLHRDMNTTWRVYVFKGSLWLSVFQCSPANRPMVKTLWTLMFKVEAILTVRTICASRYYPFFYSCRSSPIQPEIYLFFYDFWVLIWFCKYCGTMYNK
jgi:hypothetical protein